MQSGGNLGNFVGPLLVGYLADVTGSYLPGFFTAASFSLTLLVAGLLLPETGPKGTGSPCRQDGRPVEDGLAPNVHHPNVPQVGARVSKYHGIAERLEHGCRVVTSEFLGEIKTGRL